MAFDVVYFILVWGNVFCWHRWNLGAYFVYSSWMNVFFWIIHMMYFLVQTSVLN